MISRTELHTVLDNLLKPEDIKDYCPNGLQVEGKERIKTVVTGVTASQRLINAAIEQNADAIVVHHGYFWKGENEVITGMKKRRLQTLLAHDISLFAYHLPIDVHPEYGNNAQLAHLLGIENAKPMPGVSPRGIVYQGEFSAALSPQQLAQRFESVLGKTPLVEQVGSGSVKTIAWCSGGGQGFIDQAAEAGMDAFFSGEVSEKTIHSAREQNIHYFACGHHATERCGVKALGDYLHSQLGLNVRFIDIDNPA
ncbi:Nif3-like dinuclear metal center hexameric protein [Alteromonas lipotrueiana]|uniref:Nif3-like dinuclear metal center hexameric protein n=1 Tax=Alteromonas lipotrueiana TaxID=2803815 RepID=UPI001C49670F|nr:Nif3-like dinuclear metal center hexameric protein [Alteromonas lipotrueiana]